MLLAIKDVMHGGCHFQIQGEHVHFRGRAGIVILKGDGNVFPPLVCLDRRNEIREGFHPVAVDGRDDDGFSVLDAPAKRADGMQGRASFRLGQIHPFLTNIPVEFQHGGELMKGAASEEDKFFDFLRFGIQNWQTERQLLPASIIGQLDVLAGVLVGDLIEQEEVAEDGLVIEGIDDIARL